MRICFLVLIGFLGLISPSLAQDSTNFTVEDGYAAHDAGDYNKARQIMETLAATGDAKAINAIGVYYAKGEVYPKDRKVACDWYEKSADMGYKSAQSNLANCYGDLGGRERNLDSWLYWKELSANNGHKNAQLNLISYYIQKDEKKSFYWAKKAAAQGSTAARVTLWQFDQDNDIPPVSIIEITCVFIKIDLFQQHSDSCD